MTEELDRQAARNFESLLTEYQRRLYFFIRSMVFDPEDARDVLQDVNMIAVRKREQFAPGTDFKAWLFAIARFECLTYLSRRKKLQWSSLDSEMVETLANKAEERADDVEPWLGALAKCREELPAEAVELLMLRYQHRVMLETVAERWKTSVGALKQKLFRIRALLKECIHQRLGRAEISGDDTPSS
jgi:RNA polymerase sigma-70 factor (ECF subfamily)